MRAGRKIFFRINDILLVFNVAPESSGATLEITLLDSSTLAGQVELALKPRLLDQVRDCLRRRHYSLRTEKVYVGWIRRYVLFHDRRGKQ